MSSAVKIFASFFFTTEDTEETQRTQRNTKAFIICGRFSETPLQPTFLKELYDLLALTQVKRFFND